MPGTTRRFEPMSMKTVPDFGSKSTTLPSTRAAGLSERADDALTLRWSAEMR